MTMLPNIEEAMEDARNGKLSPYWQNNLKRECLHLKSFFLFLDGIMDTIREHN